MDVDEREERSQHKERLERTGEKMKMNEDPLVESKYEMNEQTREQEDRNSRLDQIEAEIRQHGKRLEQIRREELAETDEYS